MGVTIIDGEIVPDTDPRVQARLRQRQQTVSGAGAAHPPSTNAPYPNIPAGVHALRRAPAAVPAGGRNGLLRGISGNFDTAAPPFRILRPPPGEVPFDLPDVVIFGLQIPPIVIGATAAAVFLAGWRGLAVLPLIWLLSAGAPPAGGGRAPADAGRGRALAEASRVRPAAGTPAQNGGVGGVLSNFLGEAQAGGGMGQRPPSTESTPFTQPANRPAGAGTRGASTSSSPAVMPGKGRKLGSS